MKELESNQIDLVALRESVGLTARELARQLDVHHSTVLKWEELGRVAKSEYIAPVSEILGVSVEELLGLPKRRTAAPAGRARQTFEEVSKLPRSKQKKILDVVDALIKAD
jgi:transcriptional regulator with XRE-family HTH domain